MAVPASVVAINGGSSSIKFAVYQTGSHLKTSLSGKLDRVGLSYQAKKWVGAFAAALGGLDTLVFSGGIGEQSASIRARICDGLGFLGVELDDRRNAGHAAVISADASRAVVRVIPTNEELMIARSVSRMLGLDAHTMERDA